MNQQKPKGEAPAILLPQDIRRELQKIAAQGSSALEDSQFTPTDPIIRNVLLTARYQGWSGEDTYSILAWHLKTAADHFGRQALEWAQLDMPIFTVDISSIDPIALAELQKRKRSHGG